MNRARAAFHRWDGEGFVPTGLGVSPWNKRSQSGVSLAGLIVHVLEGVATRVPMMTARVTVDIMGTVPMEPLTPHVTILRDGARMQLVEATLTAGDRTWVRASALRCRMIDTPPVAHPLVHPVPNAADITNRSEWFDVVGLHGGAGACATGAMWIRLTGEVVEGVPLTPLQRLAIIADFGAGVAPVLSRKAWTLANLDIGMHMTREARGEWLLLESTAESAGNGVGVATARIGDRDGMFATSLQTTFLDRRV